MEIIKHLQQVNSDLQVQVQPGSVLSNNGERLAKAMADKETVKESSALNFEDTLRYIMLMLGIRAQNLPGQEETDVLIRFIKCQCAKVPRRAVLPAL